MKQTIALLLCVLALNARGADMDKFDYSPLEGIAVQDHGFVKSFLTFATERARIITGKTRFEKHHPIGLVLGLTFEAQAWHDKRMLKVDHPMLVDLFQLKAKGVKRITLNEYGDSAFRTELTKYLQSSQSVGKATQELNHKVSLAFELEQELALVPRVDADWTHARDRAVLNDPDSAAIRDAFLELRDAYVAGDAAAFDKAARALADASALATAKAGVDASRLKIDRFNTQLAPFRRSYLIYLFAALAYLGVLVFRWRRVMPLALGLMALGLGLHVTGLTLRWMLAGRAPVSNLYESFVFAVAGIILFAILMALFWRKRSEQLADLGGFFGALLGFIFMVIASLWPVTGSQLKPLMPALQSPWLTYHVITIMLSYSAFAISFLASLTYLGVYFIKRETKGPFGTSSLEWFNYRTIAIGFPLLTIGIITGAIWAATAWGRPWGFDPKETWSAITWLIYGVYLHARFLPWGKGVWSAVLAIVGFAAVVFTYLGVNYLLSGLHSYAG